MHVDHPDLISGIAIQVELRRKEPSRLIELRRAFEVTLFVDITRQHCLVGEVPEPIGNSIFNKKRLRQLSHVETFSEQLIFKTVYPAEPNISLLVECHRLELG